MKSLTVETKSDLSRNSSVGHSNLVHGSTQQRTTKKIFICALGRQTRIKKVE